MFNKDHKAGAKINIYKFKSMNMFKIYIRMCNSVIINISMCKNENIYINIIIKTNKNIKI